MLPGTHLRVGLGAGEELEGDFVLHSVHSLQGMTVKMRTVVSDTEQGFRRVSFERVP